MSRGANLAAMTQEQIRAFGRSGGVAVQAKGTAYRWNSATAREAGKRGGAAVAARPGHMAELSALAQVALRPHAHAVRLYLVGNPGAWKLRLKRGRKVLDTLARGHLGEWEFTCPGHEEALAVAIPLVAQRQGFRMQERRS